MKNLIKAIETQEKKRLEDFILAINLLTELKQLDTWQYNDLLPKGKNVSAMSFTELKAYLITRKEKAVYKSIERQSKQVSAVCNAGELVSVKISVEWKKSRMWGANPNAECWVGFIDKDGNSNSLYVTSGSIGGCGYDKLSTAIADCLNQVNEVLKPLYLLKDANISKGNHDLLGYGSGYGILPRIEGGVGANCYNKVFDTIGYKFECVSSGKTYDVYTITKK